MTASAPMPDRIERLSALAQALVGAPTQEDLARLLVMRIFDAWSCRGALIFRPESSGSLALQAVYGYSDDAARALAHVTYNPESPMHRAMSVDDILWFPDDVDVAEAHAGQGIVLPGTRGLIVMPVTHVGIPEHVLVLCFAEPLPSNPASEPFVSAVRSLLELQSGGSVAPQARSGARRDGHDAGALHPADVELTDRQLQILGMLAKGRTNRAIAVELGFSESTIRQETLRLYRALEVNSRSDAVAVARSIGLLPSD